jgi:hypothetical protein
MHVADLQLLPPSGGMHDYLSVCCGVGANEYRRDDTLQLIQGGQLKCAPMHVVTHGYVPKLDSDELGSDFGLYTCYLCSSEVFDNY